MIRFPGIPNQPWKAFKDDVDNPPAMHQSFSWRIATSSGIHLAFASEDLFDVRLHKPVQCGEVHVGIDDALPEDFTKSRREDLRDARQIPVPPSHGRRQADGTDSSAFAQWPPFHHATLECQPKLIRLLEPGHRGSACPADGLSANLADEPLMAFMVTVLDQSVAATGAGTGRWHGGCQGLFDAGQAIGSCRGGKTCHPVDEGGFLDFVGPCIERTEESKFKMVQHKRFLLMAGVWLAFVFAGRWPNTPWPPVMIPVCDP